jgi:DNA repair protein RecO (recombination protein O)
VIRSRNRGISDSVLDLFTRDAGVLSARALALREEKSKMRYALQPFSFVRVSLIRGKREWRVSGAEVINNMFFSSHERNARGHILSLTELMWRLVRGEEPHAELFDSFLESLTFLSKEPSEEGRLASEIRLLEKLGYIPQSALSDALCGEYSCESAAKMLHSTSRVKEARRMVASALDASQL